MKNVQVRSFFWSLFSCIWTRYEDLLRKFPYSVRIQENTDQTKLSIWTLLTKCRSARMDNFRSWNLRRIRPEEFCKKTVLRNFANFTGKHLRQSLIFNKVAGLRHKICNFIKKETLTQVFSCEFCEISKNTVSYRTPLVVASEISARYLG